MKTAKFPNMKLAKSKIIKKMCRTICLSNSFVEQFCWTVLSNSFVEQFCRTVLSNSFVEQMLHYCACRPVRLLYLNWSQTSTTTLVDWKNQISFLSDDYKFFAMSNLKFLIIALPKFIYDKYRILEPYKLQPDCLQIILTVRNISAKVWKYKLVNKAAHF